MHICLHNYIIYYIINMYAYGIKFKKQERYFMAKKISSAILALFLTFVMLVNSGAPAVSAASNNSGQTVNIVTSGEIKVEQKLATKKKKLKIVKQPTSIIVVPNKKTAKATVKASGDKVKYRWYYKNAGEKKYTKTSVTKSYYSVKMSKKVNNRKVYCLITDKYGKKIKTNVVTLKMGKTLKVTTQPKSVTVLSGQTAKVTTEATGDKVKYRWYYKNAGKSKYTKTSVTKNYYSVKMSSSVANRSVYCLITDKHGVKIKTNVVTLAMGKTLKITSQPQAVVVRKNATASVNVAVYGDGVKYEWYYKDVNAAAFAKATSNTNVYSVAMNSAISGRQVYCKITDKYGKSVISNTVTLTMATELTIAKQPESQTVYCGSVAKISVDAIGDGLQYKWFVKKASDTEFILEENIAGNEYQVNVDESLNGAMAYCVVTDKYGDSVTSETATITAATPLVINEQPKSQAIYSGSKSNITVGANGDGLEYKWYIKKSTDEDFVLETNYTSNVYDVVVDKSLDGAKVYCVVTDKYSSSVTSDTATITAATVLKIDTEPKSETVYCGSKSTVFVEATGDDLTYKWFCKKTIDNDFVEVTDFTTNRYEQIIDYSFDGAKIYCVVTDKYGSSVTSETATITAATVLSITSRPNSETTDCGTEISVSVGANGDGLIYEWYVKKADQSEFSVDATYTTFRYNAVADNTYEGAELYCVITDKYGDSVTTNTAIITVKHNYNDGVVTKDPTCQEVGTKLFSCGNCTATYTEDVEIVDHDMSDWSTIIEPTPYEQGLKRQECEFDCGFKNEQPIDVLDVLYNITVYTDDSNYYFVGVGDNGKYSLEEPTRFGYVFKGWIGADSETFDASGKVFENVTVRAIWEADDTDTKEKLLARVNAGVEEIKITSNIVVDEPIYITNKTTVYSNANYSLVRAEDYAGDIFVVGQDAEANFSILEGVNATLTLGGGEGELTIDGNCENTTTEVVGALVFSADSSIVNLYDGVKLANNTKTANKRTTDLDYGDYMSQTALERIGGAGIVNLNSTLNIYGGVIENNTVKTEHTVFPSETEGGSDVKKEIAGCGGGIYNNGNINMYGGTIKGNEALRGGGIYNNKIVYAYAGTIAENKSYTYGGAISSSSSGTAEMHIGTEEGADTVVISGNNSVSAGGALYSSTTSPIIIYGNVEFNNNRSETSGGAIYTAGTLTLSNAKFSGNSCNYSGGAIYHHYGSADYTRRIFDVDNCEFNENVSSCGGAVTLSANSSIEGEGTEAYFDNCEFTGNSVVHYESNPGNGGAIYVTRSSDVIVNNCSFKENSAASCAGAISVHSNATLDVNKTEFEGNTALTGGAIYSTSNASVDIVDSNFTANATIETEPDENGKTKVGNGGAVYLYNAAVTIKNVGMYNNTSSNNAGAFYIGGRDVTIDSTCEFIGNTAANHGGAIYVTYQTTTNEEDVVEKIGSKVKVTGVKFQNNTALSGGAISARSYSELTLKDAIFAGNTTPNAKVSEDNGGGAIYINTSTLDINNVEFSDNASGYYGGAIKATDCEIDVVGTNFTGTSGGTGAVMYAANSTLNINDVTLEENTSNFNGFFYFNKTNAIFDNLTATNNTGKYGFIYAGNKSNVEVNDSEISNNTAINGAAVYLVGSATVDLNNTLINKNTTTGFGGAAYIESATLNVNKGTVISENTAPSAAAICATVDKKDDGSYVESTINLTEAQITDNTATNHAGGIHATNSNLNINDKSIIKNNTAGKNGGAIYIVHTDANISGANTEITNNSAAEHGGAFYVSYENVTNGEQTDKLGGVLNVTDALISENTALNGGAISARTNSIVNLSNLTLSNNSTPEAKVDMDQGGGAIYSNNSEITLSNVNVSGNSSGYYGGALKLITAHLTLNNGTIFQENSGATGAVMHLSSSSSMDADNIVITNNESTTNGLVYLNGKNFNFNKLTANNNKAAWNSGLLYINAGSTNVNIDNSTITDSETINGGAIYALNGITTITNTTFDGNKATSGGAIYAENGTVTLGAGTIIQNHTTTGNGGAISASNNATINVDGAEIKNNTAANGGAVCVQGAVLRTSEDALFEGNVATNHGGAVYIGDYTAENSTTTIEADVVIEDAIFNENTSKRGGAIYAGSSTYTVNDTEFNKNTAVDESYGGGAIYSTGSVGDLSGVTLTENSSTKGGAVALHSNSVINATSLVATKNNAYLNSENKLGVGGVFFVNNSTLNINGTDLSVKFGAEDNGNTAQTGAAIYTENNAVVSITGAEFTGNSTVKSSGAVYIASSTVNGINNSKFQNNSSNTNAGAVYISGSTVSAFEDNTFIGNTSDNHGGALYVNGSTVNAGGSNVFEDNSAANHGGAIYVAYIDHGDNVFTGGVLNMTGGRFNNNTAMGGGAVSIRSHSSATFNGTEFTNNSVEGCDKKNGEDAHDGNGEGGGAIYVGFGTLGLTNVTATDNQAEGFGGAVDSIGSTITVSGGTYSNNQALDGGAFYNISNTKLTIEGAQFNGNKSTFVQDTSNYKNGKGGGAINMQSGELTVKSSTFDENQSAYYGGAILTGSAKVIIEENSVITNSIGKTGAALCFVSPKTVAIKDSSVTDTAGSGSGVIYISGGSATLENTTVSGNNSYNGGALYFSGSANVTIDGSSFTNNKATNFGGVIDNRSSGAINITNTTISENNAKTGGAIYTTKGTITLTGSTITKNTATNGGAIYSEGGTVTLGEGTVVDENTASSNGGAASLVNKAKLNVYGATLSNNTANNGGSVYVSGAVLNTGEEALFDSNNAKNSGGAVYINKYTVSGEDTVVESDAEIVDATFNNNTASSGAAILVTDTTVSSISRANFTNNSATSNGGAVYLSGSTVTSFVDNAFTANSANSNGGAVDIVASTINASGDNEFVENTAVGHGGAIYITYIDHGDKVYTGGILNMSDGLFDGNTAMGGGAVSIRSHCEATFDGTEFTSNSVAGCNQKDGADAPDGDGEGGGAIYVGYGELTLNNVTATENNAEVFGGVIDGVSSTINVSGGTYSNNHAANGGVFYNISSTKLYIDSAEFTANKSTFDNSSTWDNKIGGGAINMFGGELSIKSSVFDANETDYYGGAILAEGTKVTIEENSEFKNSVGKTGSAIGFKNVSSLTIKDSKVTNTVGSGNGVVYISGGNATLENVTASGNNSNAGGVMFISGGAKVDVLNSTFTNNTATGNGGAISHGGSKALTITNTTISGNTAKNGGFMYATGTGIATVSGCTIKENTATTNGGAIFATRDDKATSSSKIIVSNGTIFKDNTAKSGGAVYLDKGATFTVNDSEFDGNDATSGIGGAIVVADSSTEEDLATTLNATGVTFKNNTATSRGGAISTGEGAPAIVINVDSCVFDSNSSTTAGGGAVDIQNKNQPDATDPEVVNIVFTNCEFKNNTSKTTGAAVEIRTSSAAKFDGVVATNNKATGNGGVFYVTSDFSRLYLTGTVSASGNTAASGKFAYLYKVDTYTNPPKIYTTHSNSASWVADVKGNSSNILFDLVTLP